MPVTLRQLRYFQALVEHGSFSRAARNLHISQPALSVQIRELEATFGGPLVERQNRGIALTRLGRDAFEQTLRVLDETLLLETLGKRFQDGPVRITLGILPTLAPYMLTGILERLDGISPSVSLSVVEAPGEKLVSDLLASRIDAVVVSVPLGLLELSERPLFVDRFLLAGRPERLASIRNTLDDKVRPAEIARADMGPLLTLGHSDCLAAQVLGACLMWRIPEVQRGAGSLATLSRLVSNGAGLTLLPETAASAERAASPGLHFLRFTPPEPSRHIGLAHRVAVEGQKWIDILATAITAAGKALVADAAAALGVSEAKKLRSHDAAA